MPDPIAMLPICLAPQADVPPHSYVLVKHLQVCLHCQSQHEWSEPYSKTFLRSRWERKYVTNLRPIRSPADVQYNLPIGVICREPTRVPFCHECFASVTLSHLPSPPKPEDKSTIIGTSSPAEGGTVTRSVTRSAKPKPTIDDLLL